eukprot:TRINITY_DN22452_c0_g1_i1.p1 TRINITY_DN22452_c0_g1~~TRINITY_DN22452_c0_g1_i1.p1  ORF type:complete len:980 (+),score=261.36 TRINITY_DN22452_c0_g1_i1:79-3018(+)
MGAAAAVAFAQCLAHAGGGGELRCQRVGPAAGAAALRRAAQAALAEGDQGDAQRCAAAAVSAGKLLAPSHCTAGEVSAAAGAHGAAAAAYARCATLYAEDAAAISRHLAERRRAPAPESQLLELALPGGSRMASAADARRWLFAVRSSAGGAWQKLAASAASAGSSRGAAAEAADACAAAARAAGDSPSAWELVPPEARDTDRGRVCAAGALLAAAGVWGDEDPATAPALHSAAALLAAAAEGLAADPAAALRERARAAFERALALGHAAAALPLAGDAESRGDLSGAEQWLRRGLAAAPGEAELTAALAQLLRARGDCDAVLTLLRRTQLPPAAAWLRPRAECVLREEGAARGLAAFAAAVATLQKAGQPAAAAELGAAGGAEAVRLGEWRAARGLLQPALEGWGCGVGAAPDPDCAAAAHNLAMAEEHLGGVSRSTALYRAAAARLADSPKSFLALIHAQKTQCAWGERRRAEAACRRRLRAALGTGPGGTDRWGPFAAQPPGGGGAGDVGAHALLSQPGLPHSLLLAVLRARAERFAREAADAPWLGAAQSLGPAPPQGLQAPAPVVALVSGDCRGSHPVGRALLGLLSPAAGPPPARPAVRFLCIHTDVAAAGGDAVTAELMRGCDAGAVRVAASPVPPHGGELAEALAAAAEPPALVVDLSGDTIGGQPHFFAAEKRGLPAQAGFLGFPASAGSAQLAGHAFVDLSSAPPAAVRRDWAERAVYLCPAYLSAPPPPAAAPGAAAAAADGARVALRLPPREQVVCALTAHYKLGPELWGTWAAVLAAAPAAVLAVIEWDSAAPSLRALRAEAAARGVNPRRIVGLPPLPLEVHAAAKELLCSFALDTPLYNGHSTTLEALAAGLPVVALQPPGGAFRSRAAASLVHAAGLGALAPRSLRAYEAAAVRMLRDGGAAAAAARRTLRRRRARGEGIFAGPAYRRAFAAAASAVGRDAAAARGRRHIVAGCPRGGRPPRG